MKLNVTLANESSSGEREGKKIENYDFLVDDGFK